MDRQTAWCLTLGRAAPVAPYSQRRPLRGTTNQTRNCATEAKWLRSVRELFYAPRVLWDDDSPLEELAAVKDAEELCRQLLAGSWSWGGSTRHIEAVELLDRVHGTSELPASFVALMLCTCRRWDRVTARLIAAIEDSGLLRDADLDELAESFLSHEHVISYPLTWVSPQWLDVDLSDGPAAPTPSTNARSDITGPPSSRRCDGGLRGARCGMTRSDWRTC